MKIFQIQAKASYYRVIEHSHFFLCHSCFSILDSHNQKFSLPSGLPGDCWLRLQNFSAVGTVTRCVSEGVYEKKGPSQKNYAFQQKGFDIGNLLHRLGGLGK